MFLAAWLILINPNVRPWFRSTSRILWKKPSLVYGELFLLFLRKRIVWVVHPTILLVHTQQSLYRPGNPKRAGLKAGQMHNILWVDQTLSWTTDSPSEVMFFFQPETKLVTVIIGGQYVVMAAY